MSKIISLIFVNSSKWAQDRVSSTRVKIILILAKYRTIDMTCTCIHLNSQKSIFSIADSIMFRMSLNSEKKAFVSAFRPRRSEFSESFLKSEMTTGNEKVSDSFNWIQQVFANLSWRIKDFSQCSQFFLSSKQAWLG